MLVPEHLSAVAIGSDYPQIAITGYFTLGGTNNGPQPRKDQTYQVTDNFSWNKGRHSFKFGYDARKFQVWNPFAASTMVVSHSRKAVLFRRGILDSIFFSASQYLRARFWLDHHC